MGVLLMIAIPSFQHLMNRARTRSVENKILDALHYAQSSAIAMNHVVIFCGAKDPKNCDGDWMNGQLIASDNNQQLLYRYSGLPKGDRLWWKSSLGYDVGIKFSPSGFTLGQRGSFYYCPQIHPERYGVIITVNDSGRARVTTDPQQLKDACSAQYNTLS